MSDLDDKEREARDHSRHNPLYLLLVNSYSTIVVFIVHLISLESIVSIILSVSITVYLYDKTEQESFDGSTLDWVLLSFAVVTPISSAIGMAFTRRDRALHSIARLRATSIEVYASHASWDWGFKGDTTGRERSSVDWLEHSDMVLNAIIRIFVSLSKYVTLPTSSRARHKVTSGGRREAKELLEVSAQLYEIMVDDFASLSALCETLKGEGLPANEASRIRQWERMMLEDAENVRAIKKYRTPQGLRSFGRLFSVFLPPFYSPYYVQMARDLNSLGVGVAFSVLTSIALTALFETVHQLEEYAPTTTVSILKSPSHPELAAFLALSPFVASSELDGIHVGQGRYYGLLFRRTEVLAVGL